MGAETEPEVFQRLTSVFQDVFDDDDIVLTPEFSAADLAAWDSLSHVRLILAVERAFSVKFSASSIGGLKNVGDLVALIQARS